MRAPSPTSSSQPHVLSECCFPPGARFSFTTGRVHKQLVIESVTDGVGTEAVVGLDSVGISESAQFPSPGTAAFILGLALIALRRKLEREQPRVKSVK